MPYTHELKASDHPVKSVTIFTAGTSRFGPGGAKAEVVRGFNLELGEGENRIHIHGLSTNMELDTARVSGLADDIRVYDVVATLKHSSVPEDDSPQETIRLLKQKKTTLENLKAIRIQEANILVQYGMSLKGDQVSPDQASAFISSFVKSGQENIHAAAKLEEEILTIDREISTFATKVAEKKGRTDGDVCIVVSSRVATTAELRLTYIVSGVAWKATYDLHATTDNGQPSGSVELQFRARIMQVTGEDWSDTQLTLSTASFDSVGQGLPKFKSLRVAPIQKNHGSFGGGGNKNGAFSNMNNSVVPHPAFGASTGMNNSLFGQASANGAYMRSNQQIQSQLQPPAQYIQSQMQQQQQSASAFGQAQQASNAFGAFGSAPGPPGGASFGATSATQADGSSDPYTDSLAAAESQETSEEDGADNFTLSEFTDILTESGTEGARSSKPKTVVSESPFSTTYKVEGKSSIPSDGIEHQVLVAMLPFDAKLSYIALPRAQTVAYLQCEVRNTSEYRLLPGPVNVFMDGSSVSRTQIQDINTGDTFECTLGVDPSIRLTFARTMKPTKIEGGAYADQTRIVPYLFTTTIKNTHRFALSELVIRDSIPVAGDDKRVRVVLRKPSKLAEAKEGELVNIDGADAGKTRVAWGKNGHKEGKLEWTTKVDSGEEVKLEMEFEVRGPAEVQWQLKVDP